MTAVLDGIEAGSPDERVLALADAESVVVRQRRDGALWATANLRGVPSVVFSLDHRIQGGAMHEGNCAVIVAAYQHALREKLPIVGLWHSGGARLQDGVHSLNAVARVFHAMTAASGRIPQISVVLGAAAGGAAYGPGLTDVVIMAPHGKVFITGPTIIEEVTGEQIDADSLGGPEAHDKASGVAHLVAETERDAYRLAAAVAELLGAPRRTMPDLVEDRPFGELLPDRSKRAYDIHPVLDRLLDDRPVELQAGWARSIVTTLGRFGGGSVGVVASNPLRRGGCLDSRSAEKAARFVRLCDSLGLPLIVVVDVPGYLPGVAEEHGGVVRRGAKLLHAFAEATVPRVTVVLRKAYGGAYIAMNCRGLGADRVFAWPQAEIAVMGATAAVRLLHRRELAAVAAQDRNAVEMRLTDQHLVSAGGLSAAVQAGVVDEIIEPDRTRSALAAALAGMPSRRGEHGNIPL
ncbi:propionyl-CoA carboxylase subunit beta [Amycolatopsis sp. AA4]|uniref:acyl-CoA carboxylase subunit beta n=1 Tax=Actinomycetes TaxID=1760 RepID=UPI0001B56AB3|nr:MULTISPECIES: carboxyl transferase domain-containing protein [Actinomycetes]ATY11264.1 propionyl-CoA carboxylase subunit beta [Amycolatopsis sp. AA4]EFL06854.1 propionyl-CoA carboxylase [Streptomyces sp. AA4]